MVIFESELRLDTILSIFNEIKLNKDTIKSAKIFYKKHDKEYLTENISLDWLWTINSHDFFVWSEYKLAQKQKYNIKNYFIIIRITYKKHTNR